MEILKLGRTRTCNFLWTCKTKIELEVCEAKLREEKCTGRLPMLAECWVSVVEVVGSKRDMII